LKKLLSVIPLLAFSLSVQCQVLKGLVLDGNTFQPVPGVSIQNTLNGQTAKTDSNGNFRIQASPGDNLSFSLTGYHTLEKTATSSLEMGVELLPISVNLPEYTVHELTKFQKDSIELATTYAKELNQKAVKPGFSSANGGGFTGLIGAPVQRMSRSYKQNKKFKEAYRKDMEQRFIDTRYKPELVTSLTGLTGDSLISFINSHPMDYAFARSATDLEIKAWIRDSYKDYLARSGSATKQ